MRSRLGEVKKEYCCSNVISAVYWLPVYKSSVELTLWTSGKGLDLFGNCLQVRSPVQGTRAATLSSWVTKSLIASVARLRHWRSPALTSSPTQNSKPVILLERMAIMNGMRMLDSKSHHICNKEGWKGAFWLLPISIINLQENRARWEYRLIFETKSLAVVFLMTPQGPLAGCGWGAQSFWRRELKEILDGN